MLKYQDEWAFVSPYDGLGGPPIYAIYASFALINT
jgi:hypothetical protein